VGSASAGTASLAVAERNGVQLAWVVYRADPGEHNNVGVFPDWSEDGTSILDLGPFAPRPPTAFVVADGVHEHPGAGCERGPGGNSDSVRCEIPAGALVVGPRVYLADRLDEAEIDANHRWRGTEIFGGHGNDTISGKGLLSGGSGDDTLAGSGQFFGGPGRDSITSGSDNDQITAGIGADWVQAEAGNDTIRARDGQRDLIDCGPGRDAVVADAIDSVGWEASSDSAKSCERVRRSSPARALLEDVYAYEDDPDVTVGILCPWDGPRRCIGRFEFRIGNWILGPERLTLRRGHRDWWSFEIGSRAVERLDGKHGRAIIRSFDARGVLRTVSTSVRLYVEVSSCGDC
jgi:hypothetical protein